jgi:hypothetical protein
LVGVFAGCAAQALLPLRRLQLDVSRGREDVGELAPSQTADFHFALRVVDLFDHKPEFARRNGQPWNPGEPVELFQNGHGPLPLEHHPVKAGQVSPDTRPVFLDKLFHVHGGGLCRTLPFSTTSLTELPPFARRRFGYGRKAALGMAKRGGRRVVEHLLLSG